jgi:hypothetical protein
MEYRKESLFTHPLMKNHQMEKQLARSEEDIEILKKFERFLQENP